MRKLLSLIPAVFLAMASTVSAAPASLTQVIDGEVGRGIFGLAEKLVSSSATGELKNVRLVINSPGGDVLAGHVYIVAMEVAKARGVTFDCYVPLLAASMAFQVLAHCDNRYALPGALLLWHPPRVVLNDTLLTPDLAAILAEELDIISNRLTKELQARMPMDELQFWYHFRAETLHTAEEVNALSPGYLNLVTNIPDVVALIPGSGTTAGDTASDNGRPWRFTYVWEDAP